MGLFDGVSLEKPFGGENSFFNKPGQIFGGNDSFFRKPFGSKPEGPAAPPPPPDPAQARTDALQAQLDEELQMRRSSSLMTGGLGVTDQPQILSAGQLLYGS